MGIPKRVAEKNANKALELGLTHKDTRGSLHRYIEALYWKERTANNVRIYCGNVYIFHDQTLITIFPLPQKYRKMADAIAKKTRKEDT